MRHALLFATLAVAVVTACGKDEGSTGAATSDPSERAPATAADPAADAKLTPVLAPYERLRTALADDVLDVADGAKALEAAAEKVIPEATGGAGRSLRELAAAADQLATMDKSKPDDVRKQFGEVSRAFVALLHAAPSLQAGRFLFHCPMAQGFPKWVQNTEKMANPYMGKAMLECGSKRDW